MSRAGCGSERAVWSMLPSGLLIPQVQYNTLNAYNTIQYISIAQYCSCNVCIVCHHHAGLLMTQVGLHAYIQRRMGS